MGWEHCEGEIYLGVAPGGLEVQRQNLASLARELCLLYCRSLSVILNGMYGIMVHNSLPNKSTESQQVKRCHREYKDCKIRPWRTDFCGITPPNKLNHHHLDREWSGDGYTV